MTACTRTAANVAGVDLAPCPDCGHTLLVHPSALNPALTACALCALTAQASDLVDLRQTVDTLADPTPTA